MAGSWKARSRTGAAVALAGALAACSSSASDTCEDPLRSLEEVLAVTGNAGAEQRTVDGAYCATVPTVEGDVEACKLPTPLYAERYAEDHDAVVEWLTISMRGPAPARAAIVEQVDSARARCL